MGTYLIDEQLPFVSWYLFTDIDWSYDEDEAKAIIEPVPKCGVKVKLYA